MNHRAPWLIMSLWFVDLGSPAQAACPAAESAGFICGTSNAEDLVQLPATPWVVTSGREQPGRRSGHLFLVNSSDRTVRELYPLARNRYRHDQVTFGACQAPDEQTFAANGVNIRPLGNDKFMLYVVNRGGRDSVEIFELEARGKEPAITWIGCETTPEAVQPLRGNAVAVLPEGAFALSLSPTVDITRPENVDKIKRGQIAGRVVIWSPGFGWHDVPGSELPFNNGIEASPDGRWLYVSATLEPGIFRLSLGKTPVDRAVVKTTFYPDNVRWGDDGLLYAAGAGGTLEQAAACVKGNSPCPVPFNVIRIDPRTLESRELINAPGSSLFGFATGVAKVGNEIWVSSLRGPRIAVFPMP